jgi:hypothetical protein
MSWNKSEHRMDTSNGKSIIGLIGQLPDAAKSFVRKEIDLVKTEISEKISSLGRNLVALLVGGFIAVTGLTLLLNALAFVVASAFTHTGLSWLPALAAGFGAVGLLIAIVGSVLVAKGSKQLSSESLTPEKSVETLKADANEAERKQFEIESHADSPSDHAQAAALGRKSDLEETLDQIGERLSPRHIKGQVQQAVKAKPYHWAVGSMMLGTVGGFLIRHRSRRARLISALRKSELLERAAP